MRLYKHNDKSFTLVTHDNRIYGLHEQGENQFVANYCGKAGPDYRISGLLLYKIPDFLKSKCFKLNRKPNEQKC
jgi:hypothetical protein